MDGFYQSKLISAFFLSSLLLLLLPVNLYSLTDQEGSILSLTEAEQHWLEQKNIVKIRVGSAPPFTSNKGKIEGIAIDYLESIFRQHNIQYKYISKKLSWKEALEAIKASQTVDLLPTAKITAERKRDMLFTDEYIFSPWVIFNRKGSSFVGTINDLSEKTVCVPNGYVMHGLLKEKYPEINLNVIDAKEGNPADQCLELVASGAVDAYIGNLSIGTYLIQHNGYASLKVAAPTPFDNHNQSMAVRSDWPELVSIINKTLSTFTQEQHSQIINKWLTVRFDHGISVADIVAWVLGVAAVFVVILILGYFWNLSLKKEITKRAEAELGLRNSEERSRKYFELGLIGMAITSPEKGWVEFNNTLHQMFGYSREEFCQLTWAELTHPESLETDLVQFNRVLAGEIDSYSLDKRFIHKDGSTLYAEISASAVRKTDGSVDYFVALVQDISERKHAEEERERIILNSPVPMVVFDKQGDILLFNKKFTTQYGYTIGDISTANEWWGNVYPDLTYRKEVQTTWEKAVAKAKATGDEIESQVWDMTSKNGLKHTVEFSMVPMENMSVICMVDITKRISLEKQLRQTHKMEAIGTMAGGIAHDFNNLLSIIVGNVDIINSRLGEGDVSERNIEHLKSASSRAKDLVNQILTFSRQESQTLIPVVIDTVLADTVRLLRATIPKTVEILFPAENGIIVVKADKTQIQQVIINLCSNAVHAMNGKGLLHIELKKIDHTELKVNDLTCKQADQFAILSVTDTGCGMDQETIDRAFDPFFTTKEVGAGTGMGLSVIHGIVEQHGGFITIDSTLGKGTTFNVYLPITEEVVVTPHKEIKTLPTGTEKILFIDDEESIAYTCDELLECQGYTVTSVTSSIEALEIFKARPQDFDLVFTDQTMPEMTGSELATQLLRIRADIPIILCSGFSAKVSEEEAKGIGIREFCMKPMDMEQLATVTRKVLDESGK